MEKIGCESHLATRISYPHPLFFAYVGETKGLPAEFVDVGETKDLGDFSVRRREWDGPKWHKSSVPSA
jgi:hypothetical protein